MLVRKMNMKIRDRNYQMNLPHAKDLLASLRLCVVALNSSALQRIQRHTLRRGHTRIEATFAIVFLALAAVGMWLAFGHEIAETTRDMMEHARTWLPTKGK